MNEYKYVYKTNDGKCHIAKHIQATSFIEALNQAIKLQKEDFNRIIFIQKIIRD